MMERILIIEDEPEMLRNLTTILRLEKFRPLSAAGGRLGVDLAKKRKPDLILCDVTMPGLDGYGVIAALRADPETVTIPFIFLTAKAEKFDASAGMNLGADDYITKPVAKADLLAAIRSRLARAVLGRCECDRGAPLNVVTMPNTAQKIVPNNSRSDSSLRFQNRRW